MVSYSEHEDLQRAVAPKRIFTFINGDGDTRKFEAENVTNAWVSFSFAEDAEVEVLVERGWQVKFK